jgi:hypothetical protein
MQKTGSGFKTVNGAGNLLRKLSPKEKVTLLKLPRWIKK